MTAVWGGRDIEFFRRLKASEPVPVPDCLDVLLQSGYHWDLARAFLLAIARPEAVRGEIFVISSKHAVTLEQYLKTAMAFLNSHSEIHRFSIKELQKKVPGLTIRYGLDFLCRHMCFDIGKAERILDYHPLKTTGQGLESALEFCLEQGIL